MHNNSVGHRSITLLKSVAPINRIPELTSIADRHSEIAAQKFQWGAVKYFSDIHKGDREWDILGSMASILSRVDCRPVPMFAEKGESPDFTLYDASKSLIAGCEVAEVLRPGYARHRFHKEAALMPRETVFGVSKIDDQWQPLTKVLRKKLLRSYITKSWLLIYYDIGMLDTEDWHTPFHVRLLREFGTTRLNMTLQECQLFKRILLLSADMRSLTEISPVPRHIGQIPE